MRDQAPIRSPLAFFGLVFALALPFWLVGGLTGVRLTPDLPLSALQFVCPAIAAAILVAREDGAAGVGALLRRAVDVERIRSPVWYLPAILLLPGIYAATYGLLWVLGLPLPTVQFPLLAAVGTLLAFFIAAECEELGWSGYAIDPMQARLSALPASLVLGLIWAAFHIVPLLQAGRALAWIGWWTAGTVAMRVLLTWIYNNTGHSVFAAALCHALANLSSIGPILDFGPGGFSYDAQQISGILLAVAAVVVTAIWGPRTLTRIRSA